MKVLLIISSIVLPLVMFFLQLKIKTFRFIFNILALIAIVIFGDIASTSIYQIIKENAVFMTTIHAIFLNPFFLATGGYLGIYFIYRLILLTIEETKNWSHLSIFFLFKLYVIEQPNHPDNNIYTNSHYFYN